ncbi:hypothetical protein GCM10009760_53100 [Kitasatospora kazusensis]|uniref:DUF2304 family protein n=1 Tax=Kitasatospora kazusensis TaxID=407974 RepID=A0ABP5LUP6_9ACTN
MAVTVSLAVFFGILTVVLYRGRAVGFWPGLTLVLFGFTLASTGLGPTINQLLTGLVHLIGSIRF